MYAKLFTSIYQGTLRGNSNGILVFTNMLAHCDKHGICDIHPRAIAEEVGLSVEAVRAAILELEAPDEESRSPEEEGRRIVRVDEHRAWGWRVVNYLKYRAIRDEDTRREQNRAAQEAWRLRKQSKPASAKVSPDQPIQRQKQKQDTEGEEEKKSASLAGASEPPFYAHSVCAETYASATCGYCGVAQKDVDKGFETDHFIPKSAGGSDLPSNLVPACHVCNQIKGSRVFKTIEEASQYIHGKLWSSNRARYAEPRKVCFGGKPPAGYSGVPAKPDDVEQQVWDDWLALRKAKSAPVTETVLKRAKEEAAKAGLSLDGFLIVWCARGSQGLEASWLKPGEGKRAADVEPEWRRKQRERTEAFIGKPAARQPVNMGEIFDVTATKLG